MQRLCIAAPDDKVKIQIIGVGGAAVDRLLQLIRIAAPDIKHKSNIHCECWLPAAELLQFAASWLLD